MAIYIPKKIKVGYNKRSDTYTGKLAYVIYYDEKGKLRKETSWNNWRDNKIDPDEFDNEPTEGFVLNKHVGGVEEQWGWNARKTYCRIYDPRGFEFEIDIANLLWILEHCNSIKGKGLDGNFVYGWDGKDLVLIPVDSPDYKDFIKLSNNINKNENIKTKDLKIGATYVDRNNQEYIYMGRYDVWTNYGYKSVDGKIFPKWKQLVNYYEKNNIPLRLGSFYSGKYNCEEGVIASNGKQHWFYSKNSWTSFVQYKSLGNKFIKCIDENCTKEYADLYDLMEHHYEFSPKDTSRIEYKYYTFDEFRNFCNSLDLSRYFILKKDETLSRVEAHIYKNHIHEINIKFGNTEYKKLKNIFEFKINEYGRYATDYLDIKTVFDKLKPMYRQIYLLNGNEYERTSDIYVKK